ncbi:uncharacterized protein LOC129953920 isoform X2 [Eupeodes corollae]|uniref:uncharacterized protein LOC129953920 isoform X2 n=1 Tax=Eupeodes corollae TaxID=290404 RepID=UPI002491E4AC|nr:uncharacterized protein LOC129953920 isoform X2 [Eupeodes corollae]
MMNLVKISLVSFIFLLISIKQNNGERGFEILMDSYNCSSNPNYAIAHVCYLNKTFYPAQAFFDIHIQHDIQKLQYSWVLFLIRNKSNKRRKLLHVKNMNACEFLAGISPVPLLRIFRDIMLDYGTMPLKCPIKKDSKFLFDGLIVDSEKFPPYVPETKFEGTVNLTSGKHFVFAVSGYGQIMQKTNIHDEEEIS